MIPIGLKLDQQGNLVFAQALESSEEMLGRWCKKTASDLHSRGLHVYLSLMLIENPQIENWDKFKKDLFSLIEKWGSIAQEYHISFFDPGITLGQSSFQSLAQEDLQSLVIAAERKTREVYTGRIGIGICCQISEVSPRGYNQIVLLSSGGKVDPLLADKAKQDAKANNVEKIFFLDLKGNRLSSIEIID